MEHKVERKGDEDAILDALYGGASSNSADATVDDIGQRTILQVESTLNVDGATRRIIAVECKADAGAVAYAGDFHSEGLCIGGRRGRC